MKKLFAALSLLGCAQVGFASDGVIMSTVRARINSIHGNNDAASTAHARFGFAMGMYATEKRVSVQSLSADSSGLFRFQKYNDQNQWQSCTVSVAELNAGAFNPQCQ